MKLNTFVQDEIVLRARALLETARTEEIALARKTKPQRDLDTIFARHPNDGTWQEFAEVIKVIFGYRPVTVPVKRENFQVMVRPANGGCKEQVWILIKANTYGFMSLDMNYITLSPVDQLATADQAEKFIKNLEKLKAEELYNWIVRCLGVDTFSGF